MVSTWVEALLPETFTPVPDQSYLTVRLGLKLDPVAVAVTGSPAKTSLGCTEQAALGDIGGAPPPNINIDASLQSYAPEIGARSRGRRTIPVAGHYIVGPEQPQSNMPGQVDIKTAAEHEP